MLAILVDEAVAEDGAAGGLWRDVLVSRGGVRCVLCIRILQWLTLKRWTHASGRHSLLTSDAAAKLSTCSNKPSSSSSTSLVRSQTAFRSLHRSSCQLMS